MLSPSALGPSCLRARSLQLPGILFASALHQVRLVWMQWSGKVLYYTRLKFSCLLEMFLSGWRSWTRRSRKRHTTGNATGKSYLCIHTSTWSTIMSFIACNICSCCSFLSQQGLLPFYFYTWSLNWHVEVHESLQWPLRKWRCFS